jgi:hypothetical protein
MSGRQLSASLTDHTKQLALDGRTDEITMAPRGNRLGDQVLTKYGERAAALAIIGDLGAKDAVSVLKAFASVNFEGYGDDADGEAFIATMFGTVDAGQGALTEHEIGELAWSARRAANSGGPGSPRGPLGTPFRTLGTLSGLTKTH